jgi:glycosyltransferase involved in cell wall biosynthesis
MEDKMNLWSVIPAQDEERTITHVIRECLAAGSTRVIVVCNGTSDGTLDLVEGYPDNRVSAFWEPEPLGIDVPRAIGAVIAYRQGADGILFCDGDLSGNIASHLSALLATTAWGYDLSLTDCYPKGFPSGGIAGRVIKARLDLNSGIGREDLGAAVMSHGPSCISRKFMESVPYQALAIPPLAQALAVKQGLNVKIGASIAHGLLGSRERRGNHPDKTADLIIGDCILAKSVFDGHLPVRCANRRAYIGLDNTRRWDLLQYHVDRIIAQTGPL